MPALLILLGMTAQLRQVFDREKFKEVTFTKSLLPI